MDEIRISEPTFLLPALYFVETEPGISTSRLIAKLTDFFHPVGKDAEFSPKRPDSLFSQKVRNLKSHHQTNLFGKHTTFDENGYYINDLGKDRLHQPENWATIHFLLSNQLSYYDILAVLQPLNNPTRKKKPENTDTHKKRFYYSENDTIYEGTHLEKRKLERKRSERLRDEAIQYYKKADGRIYCAVCNFCFEDHYSTLGTGYIEIHHEKPLFQYQEEDFIKYLPAAIQNVKPVCSNCHRMLHRNRTQEPLTIKELITLMNK